MLNDVSEIASEPEVIGQLISCCYREIIVQPVVTQVCRSNLSSLIWCRSTEIVIGKTAYEFTLCILHCCVFTLQLLPLQTGTIVEILLIGDIPIVSEVESLLVFASLVILRGVLVEIVEVAVALVGIPNAQGKTAICRNTLIIHGCI